MRQRVSEAFRGAGKNRTMCGSIRFVPAYMRKDLNVSRRLRRMLKASGLPLAGKAHWLRMRYVQLTHVLLMLQGQCTRGRIVMAMRDLLEGWGDTEEENADVGGYQHRLLNAIDEMQSQIEQWVWDRSPKVLDVYGVLIR
jgi:hypothetical protein